MKRVGIVGLGDQGTPIALRLIEAGWPLAFHARREEVRRRFAEKGAVPLGLPELGGASDMVLLVVGDERDVRHVALDGGLLDAMRPGAILVVHSSIPPEAVRGIAALAEARGVHLLDAPVSGGRARSYAGDLAIMVGGDPDVLEAARPVLSAYGSKIARVGPVGSGQLMKSLNNYFYAAHLATADLLPACSGSSAAFAIKAARRFQPTAHDGGADRAMDLLLEVVESLRASARRAGVDLGLVDRLVDAGMAAERAAGGGPRDAGNGEGGRA